VNGSPLARFSYRSGTEYLELGRVLRPRTVFRVLALSWLVAFAPAFLFRTVAAADAVSEDVPVPGGIEAFATSLAIEPTPDRGRFISEITRLAHENPVSRKPGVAAFLQTLAPPSGRAARPAPAPKFEHSELVPVPLTAEIWSRAVFHRKVSREELVGAIVGDHTASLLCHGLTALDDETLAYFAEHSSILTKLAVRAAPAFGAFSGSLRVRTNRLVPPGGPDAAPLWEAVVGEKVTRPDSFMLRLFEASDGRLAYLFDTIGQLDPPRRAFALGLWMPTAGVRLERFKVLASAGIMAYRDWHLRALPFNRGSHDLAMTLMRVTVDANGVPVAPASRGFWSRVFSGSDLPDDPARHLRGIDEEPFDAAWLTDTVGSVDVRQRGDRLDQLAFGQRLFGGAADRADVLVAVRALARYRMLMLSLERIGVTAPGVYASAARHAARLGALDAHRASIAQAQFQGALAIVVKMRTARTVDEAAAQQLIERLLSLPLTSDGHYAGAIAQWVRDDVGGTVPKAQSAEAMLIAALSGPVSADGVVTRLTWEGQPYRLDLGAAERLRLERVREKQEGLPLDVAVDLASAGHALSDEKVSAENLQAVLARLTAMAADVPDRVRQEDEDHAPSGLGAQPEVRAVLRKAVGDVTRTLRTRDVKRGPRLGEPLLELSDTLLAQALLSFAYAADLGDPDGTILLADDVSRRHDFGFGVKDNEVRSRTAWMQPRQEVAPGSPWHVSGSLLGMDVALAPLALRRINFDRVLEAPRLTSNQREAFAISVAFMNPYLLRDRDRDAIVDAVERGRRRLAALAGAADLDAIASELSFDGARRRALAWTLANEPERIDSLISLTELLVLGGAPLDQLSAWGMSMLPTAGCLCLRLTPPGRWLTLMGRPQLGITAAGMADLNLQVAVRLKELQLPAALARVVLSAAMQDFIDDVKPTDEADWTTMMRTARRLTREQVEDYVAAATAAGPLMPDNGRSPGPH